MNAPPATARGLAQVKIAADIVLANPYASPATLAAKCGRSQAWLIGLLNADWFQAMLQERRKAVADPGHQPTAENAAIRATIEGQERLGELMQTATPGELTRALKVLFASLDLGPKPRIRPKKGESRGVRAA